MNGWATVLLMRNDIVYQFTQGWLLNLQLLNMLHSLVIYWRVQVFGSEYIYHTDCHLYDVALYYVLYNQISFVVMEASDFESGSTEKLPHMFVKEQNGGVFQCSILSDSSKSRSPSSAEAFVSSVFIHPALMN